MKDMTFFLGANTYNGFFSLYGEYLQNAETDRVWILKGGAGCGKSGFMRRVGQHAEEAGYTVHRILCSGDPASLDGIHIPELHALLFDGTSPHVLEPPVVGDRGFYLDLSRFYRPGVPELKEREDVYREHYSRAYRWMAAAGNVDASLTLPLKAEEEIRRKAQALIVRELHKKGRADGRVRRWFTDAYTGEGFVSLPDSRRALASRLIALQGICGAENSFLATAAKTAVSRGWDTVICPDPLRPERISHILFPEQGLGLVTGEGDRTIHLDRIVFSTAGKEEAVRIRETEAMRLALLAKARKELQLAKHHHDRLEEAVNPFVDFSGVYSMAENFARSLLA